MVRGVAGGQSPAASRLILLPLRAEPQARSVRRITEHTLEPARSSRVRPGIFCAPIGGDLEGAECCRAAFDVYSVGGDTVAKKQPARQEYLAFAAALRAAMHRHGLSASEVARRVWGVTTDTRGYPVAKNRDRIGHYLRGTSYPEPENLVKLADVIGVPVAELAIDKPPTVRTPRQLSGLQVILLADQPELARLEISMTLPWELALEIAARIQRGT